MTGLGLTGNTINSITLGWTNPTDADLAHVVIRRAAGATAPAADQGTLVATLGSTKASFTDKNLTAATYSYALFAEDKAGNQSTAATVTVSTAATDSRTGLRGTLTDTAGHGIGNVLVHVRLGYVDAADAVTTSTGAYTVTNLAPGTYTVCYEPKSNVGGRSISGYIAECYKQTRYTNYPADHTAVTVTAGTMTSNVDDTLAVAGAITGRVTGPDGSPVVGVLVRTTDYQTYTNLITITAADGSYTIKNLLTNYSYSLCYDADQATGSSPDGYLSDCDLTNAYPSPGKLVEDDHTLSVGGVITGVIRDAAGNPVPGAKAYLDFSGAFATDSAGRYRINHLSGGSYYICADGSGLPTSPAAPYGYINECGSSEQVSVQINQVVTHDLVLHQAGALGGTLTESDGTQSAQTMVTVYGSDGYERSEAFTDDQGHWQVNLASGQYYVCYIAYDDIDVWTCHAGQVYDGGQPVGDLATVDPGVLTRLDESLVGGGSIAGTVTGPDGAPLANAVVNINDPSGWSSQQAITDSAGHYTANNLRPDNYRVCFYDSVREPSSPGYLTQCYGETPADPTPYSVAVSSRQQSIANAQLSLGGAIAGRVVDSAGAPVFSAYVRVIDLATNSIVQSYLYTDSDGNYGLYSLKPGDYSVCIDPSTVYQPPPTGLVPTCWQDESAQQAADPVHVVAGTISDIDVTMPIGGAISGTVTDSAGNTLSSVTVQALYADGTVAASSYTDYYGNYQFTALPDVPLAVCFRSNWQSLQPVCYANAADYSSATLVTAGSGQSVTGIDQQMVASTSGLAGVNRPGISGLASRASKAG